MSKPRTGTRNIPFFRLSAALAIASGLYGVTPRTSSLDPEFERLPFAEWSTQGKHSDIRSTLTVMPAHNSTHQRLLVLVTLLVDGRELEKRRGQGDLTILVQFEDSAHGLWQSHSSLDLAAVQQGVAHSDVEMSQYAFLLPGDYTVSVALFDTATLEHSFNTRKLRVAPLKSDPLPAAWVNLPSVEFIRLDSNSSDSWFLPEVQSELNLPVANGRPIHVDLLVNETPSERASGLTTAVRRNMNLLIPSLKILASIKLAHGAINATLLDLTQQRVAWEQKGIHRIHWNALRQALDQEQPGKIDVHALEKQQSMARFFGQEIRRRLLADDAMPHLVIVLSGPAFLEEQLAADIPAIPDRPDRRLIYVRERLAMQPARSLRPGMGPARPAAYPGMPLPADDLERAVQPLNPHVYEVGTVDEFRQALSEIIAQMAVL